MQPIYSARLVSGSLGKRGGSKEKKRLCSAAQAGRDSAGRAIHLKVEGFRVDGFWPYFALGAFYSICHSLLEEYYWRWFVFAELQKLTPRLVAIAVSSLGFAAHHVIVLAKYFGYASPLTWVFSLGVAIGGVIWAWQFSRSQSLWGIWLSHLLVDAAIFLIGYDMVRAILH